MKRYLGFEFEVKDGQATIYINGGKFTLPQMDRQKAEKMAKKVISRFDDAEELER